MSNARSGTSVAVQEPSADAEPSTSEIDATLIDWFLSLSPWERLTASASWAPLYDFRRAETR